MVWSSILQAANVWLSRDALYSYHRSDLFDSDEFELFDLIVNVVAYDTCNLVGLLTKEIVFRKRDGYYNSVRRYIHDISRMYE